MPAVQLRLTWIQQIFFWRATCGEKLRRPQADTPPILLGCRFQGTPIASYHFGFRSSVLKNGLPEEGRHEGLVPRNDVLTGGFIRFSLAQIFFVPRLCFPRSPVGVANQEGYLRCSKRFDHRSSLYKFCHCLSFSQLMHDVTSTWSSM